MRFRIFPILIVSVFVFMAACIPEQASDGTSPSSSPTAVPTASDSNIDAVSDVTAAPIDEVSGEVTDTVDEMPAETSISPTAAPVETVEEVSSEGAVCENKPGLTATDPSNVQLASGDVQLVEFFAFW